MNTISNFIEEIEHLNLWAKTKIIIGLLLRTYFDYYIYIFALKKT